MKIKIMAIMALVLMISSAYAIVIIDYSPKNTTVNNTVGERRTFEAEADHRANFSWSINNDTINKSEIDGVENVTISSYTNESAKLGTWKIKVTATNTSNSTNIKSRTWTWIVTANQSSDDNNSHDSKPLISSINETDITDTKATIKFTVNQSDADTRIYYGPTMSLGKWSNWDNTTGPRSITIDDLTKNKTYYYKIYAHNGTNHSIFSNSSIGNFKTANPIKPTISDINVSDITPFSANISFKIDQIDAKTRINYGITTSLGTWSGWNNDTSLQRIIKLKDLLNGTKYNFSIYAYNGTNQTYDTNSTIDDFTTKYPAPKIINVTPSSKTVETLEKESINFTAKFDQIVNATWELNGVIVKTDPYVTFSYYLNESSSIGTQNVSVTGRNKNGNDSDKWAWSVHPKTYRTGNRIWDGRKGMSTTYTWNSYSFSGFYYDLDENLMTEELKIKDIDRNIEEGDITYRTVPVEVNFEYNNFGKYQVIGFMADKYFAGYTSKTKFVGETISTIEDGQLHKVISDDDTKRAVYVGSTLTLGEGYVLKMKEVDIGAGPGQIWVTLLKDGNGIDDDVVAGGENYIYEKKVGTVDNLPIIVIHFDSVFRGREANAAFVKGMFQISEHTTSVKSGDRYDKMKIISINRNEIEMENRESVYLDPGDTIDLMGTLKIIVADSSDLRFELSVERTGTYEARGTIYNVTDEWTPMNFGLNVGGKNVGFYYNLDEDMGTEKLKAKVSGRNIPEGKLIYSTSPQEVTFEYDNFGKYNVIGFMAEKYFAGYTSKTKFTDEAVSTIGDGQLHKVMIDDDDKRAIYVGSTLTLEDGFVLKITDVDVSAGPGQVWVKLLKDGNEVDNDVLASGEDYIYTKKIGAVDDLSIIAVHFDSVFRGREANAAFVKGIFQISDSYIKIKDGDKYDRMEVSEVNDNKITMENDNDIDLSAGDEEKIMGNIKFKVADDSSVVRFYPFVTVTAEMMANQLVIDAPDKATAGDKIRLTITAGDNRLEGVSISIDPGIGLIENRTDSNGSLEYTLPKTLKGTYNITASKLGYEKATKNIEILRYVEGRLSLDIPVVVNQFETITIKVTSNETTVSGATLLFDSDMIGITDGNGMLNYTLNESGTHTITASKTGYITVLREIEIRVPYSEFKALNINITPTSIFENEDIYVRSNITNVGTKEDIKSIELIINDTVVGNKSILLSPYEIKEVNFVQKIELIAGNYTIKILEQEGLLEVKKKSSNILLIGAIFTIIGIIVIYVIMSKDKIAGFVQKYKKEGINMKWRN